MTIIGNGLPSHRVKAHEDEIKRKAERAGREAQAKTVSMMPQDWAFVDARVEELKPLITSRSHYFQLLVDIDKRKKIVGDPSSSSRDSRLKGFVKLGEGVRDARRKTRGSHVISTGGRDS